MRKEIKDFLYQRYYVILITVCLILAAAIMFGSFITVAKERQQPSRPHKYYTSIQIEAGDTLWKIASIHITEEYSSIEEYISEIARLNNLENDNIHEDRFLMIPYYSRTDIK